MDLTIFTKKQCRAVQAELATYPKLNLFLLYDVHRLIDYLEAGRLVYWGLRERFLQETLLTRNVYDLRTGSLVLLLYQYISLNYQKFACFCLQRIL